MVNKFSPEFQRFMGNFRNIPNYGTTMDFSHGYHRLLSAEHHGNIFGEQHFLFIPQGIQKFFHHQYPSQKIQNLNPGR